MSNPNTLSPANTNNDASSLDNSRIIDSAPEANIVNPQVTQVEYKQPEPVISSVKIDQEYAIPQESVHSNTNPSIPIENDESNIPAAIFETISSKLNPIAQKFGKGVGQLRQV